MEWEKHNVPNILGWIRGADPVLGEKIVVINSAQNPSSIDTVALCSQDVYRVLQVFYFDQNVVGVIGGNDKPFGLLDQSPAEVLLEQVADTSAGRGSSTGWNRDFGSPTQVT